MRSGLNLLPQSAMSCSSCDHPEGHLLGPPIAHLVLARSLSHHLFFSSITRLSLQASLMVLKEKKGEKKYPNHVFLHLVWFHSLCITDFPGMPSSISTGCQINRVFTPNTT
jgi:hypothetical protein